MHTPPHPLPNVQGGGNGNKQTNAIPFLPAFTRTLTTNKYSIRQNPCWTHTSLLWLTLQIPLLPMNAQEQAFNGLGGEQSTAHCNCRWNVECNNVSLWRMSHLQTLNVLRLYTHVVLTLHWQRYLLSDTLPLQHSDIKATDCYRANENVWDWNLLLFYHFEYVFKMNNYWEPTNPGWLDCNCKVLGVLRFSNGLSTCVCACVCVKLRFQAQSLQALRTLIWAFLSHSSWPILLIWAKVEYTA